MKCPRCGNTDFKKIPCGSKGFSWTAHICTDCKLYYSEFREKWLVNCTQYYEELDAKEYVPERNGMETIERTRKLLRLNSLIKENTFVFRKDDTDEDHAENIKFNGDHRGAPHVSLADEDLELVDCYFIVIGMYEKKVEQCQKELLELVKLLLKNHRINGSISFLEIGEALESQELALRLLAIGKVLGWWELHTPTTNNLSAESADRAAGMGLIMATHISNEFKKELNIS